MKKTTGTLKDKISENGSYKLVALFVTLILWVTILGRRDFVLSKEVGLDYLLPPSMTLAQGAPARVMVKVSGPRLAIKKFAQNPDSITVNLGKAQPGRVHVPIPTQDVDVPFGVKVISVTPDEVTVTVTPVMAEGESKGSDGK